MLEMAQINVDDIKECRIQLRPVDKRTVEYQELKDSIEAHGLWQPILVRPIREEDGWLTGQYEVIDGFYRFNCYKDLRRKTIPCYVRELTDQEVFVVQVQANAVRVETDPIHFASRIWRIVKEDKEMTVGEVAFALKKSPDWVRRMLDITKLSQEANEAVRRGYVSVTTAAYLAKLPKDMQRNLVKQAIAIPKMEFTAIIREELKKFRESIKTGRMEDYYHSLIEPVAHLHTLRELKIEYNNPQVAGVILVKMGAKTPMDGWMACLSWVLHLDPDAIEEQKVRFAKRKIYQDRQRKKRKEDRKKLQQTLDLEN